jgi:hypothetical protein
MIKNLLFILLFLLSFSINFAAQMQPAGTKSTKFGKIGLEEFDTKIKGQDSAAAAIKLFDIGKGYFEISPTTGSFIYVFERHVRYKVNNKNGYDLADLELHLYNSDHGGEEKVITMHGATYNLNGGKIETNKMSGDAKFSSRLDKNYIVKKYTLPNVKEGSILEYEYETKSDFTFRLDDWYFQDRYPCKYSSFTLTLPQYYQYKIATGGYMPIQRSKPVEIMEVYTIPSTSTSSSQNVNSMAQRTQYFAEDIPAIKNESYITTLEDYVSKIGFELTRTEFPGSGVKDYSSTWPKVIDGMMKEENFGGFIRRDNYDKGFLAGIVKDEKDPELRMRLIFNYVKNNIKWDGNYNYYSKLSSQRAVIEKKSGNSAEINLCLMGMLNGAGIDSYPVLISTRKNGKHPGYPLETKFNNVIIAVQIGDKKHLLDATDKNNVPDLLSYQNLNHEGLKILPASLEAEWIPMENTNVSRTVTSYTLKLDTENKLTGNLFISSNNYDGLDRRNEYQAAVTEAEFLKSYKASKPGLEISHYQMTSLAQPDQPLEELMDITIEDNMEEAGNLVYFMPLLFERTKVNPFNLEERNFPVDFAYPFEENFRMTLEFPANYQLNKLPKNESFALPDHHGTFTISYLTEGNQIAVKSRININKPVFTSDEYFNLKELYKNIVRKQAEQIVFKKL